MMMMMMMMIMMMIMMLMMMMMMIMMMMMMRGLFSLIWQHSRDGVSIKILVVVAPYHHCPQI